MRCLACNKELSDYEANRKYVNHAEIKSPELKYISLCDNCIYHATEGSEDTFNVDDLEIAREL